MAQAVVATDVVGIDGRVAQPAPLRVAPRAEDGDDIGNVLVLGNNEAVDAKGRRRRDQLAPRVEHEARQRGLLVVCVVRRVRRVTCIIPRIPSLSMCSY